MKNYKLLETDIAIIGAGAAGMVAAITSARNQVNVILIEHNDRVGKKILSTGNGKCNYTNVNQDLENYRGTNPDFVMSSFEQFSLDDTISFFEELGVYPFINRGGYYPNSGQASSVLDVLRMELERLNINTILESGQLEIKKEEDRIHILAGNKKIISKTLILATGGKAAPKLGSDGSGFQYAKQFGHHIIPTVPALVQLLTTDSCFKALSGVRVQGLATVKIDGEKIASDQGEIQLTNNGVSGIPVFQISRFASYGLFNQKNVTVELDFLTNLTFDSVEEVLRRRFYEYGSCKTIQEAMVGLLNKKLIDVILQKAGCDLHMSAIEINNYQIKKIAQTIKKFIVPIFDTKGFDAAQVTAGGIDTSEIDSNTMESKKCSRLYFAGEMIDIDGICGGYNLQWAWSSGYVAGSHAAQKVKEKK